MTRGQVFSQLCQLCLPKYKHKPINGSSSGTQKSCSCRAIILMIKYVKYKHLKLKIKRKQICVCLRKFILLPKVSCVANDYNEISVKSFLVRTT